MFFEPDQGAVVAVATFKPKVVLGQNLIVIAPINLIYPGRGKIFWKKTLATTAWALTGPADSFNGTFWRAGIFLKGGQATRGSRNSRRLRPEIIRSR